MRLVKKKSYIIFGFGLTLALAVAGVFIFSPKMFLKENRTPQSKTKAIVIGGQSLAEKLRMTKLLLRNNLQNEDFRGRVLSNRRFHNKDFSGSDFRAAHLRGVSFTESTKIDESNFNQADLQGSYIGIPVRSVNFSQSNMSHATIGSQKATALLEWTAVDFSESQIAYSKIQYIVFRSDERGRSNFAKVDFSGAKLWRVEMRNVDARGADFNEAVMQSALISGGDFRGANLAINLKSVSLRDVQIDETTRLPEGYLESPGVTVREEGGDLFLSNSRPIRSSSDFS